jgi:dihydrofolate reductase
MNKRKVILYICMSLDGFIASNDDDISWLSVVEKEGEDYGYTEFVKSIDTYMVGRKTYDKVLQLTGGVFPQAEEFDCYVITRQERAEENGINFYNGDLEELITGLKSIEGKNIYCDGGGEIVKLLMEKNLIDEYIVSIVPIILGGGKRLFPGNTPRIHLSAQPVKYFETGMVQLHYLREDG